MEKKEITSKTAVKAIITGFVSYGILIGFLCAVILILINLIINSISNSNLAILSISLPLLFVVIFYSALHLLCRLSTYDVFKKCKTNSDNLKIISKRMNLFFIICLILLVCISMGFVLIQIYNGAQSIQLTSYQYNEIYTQDFADKLTNELLSDFYYDKTNLIISTVIINLGLIISYLSLIPFQKKMINKYNK